MRPSAPVQRRFIAAAIRPADFLRCCGMAISPNFPPAAALSAATTSLIIVWRSGGVVLTSFHECGPNQLLIVSAQAIHFRLHATGDHQFRLDFHIAQNVAGYR